MESVNKRNFLFLSLSIFPLFLLYVPLKELFSSSIRSDFYDHILVIPLLSAYLFFAKRREIFSSVAYGFKAGIPLLMFGFLIFFWGKKIAPQLNQNDYSSIIACSTIFFFIGAFVSCYGVRAFRAALFPLLFLVFMIPVPTFIMDPFIYFLTLGSAEVTEWLFKLTGTTYLREGFVFHLSGVSIEVARECSGIRSTMALIVVVVLASYMFLQTNWKRLVLILALFPLTILKNGIRIVTITLLAVHVDQSFLTHSFLHKSGGVFFFIPSLALLGLLLYYLKKWEKLKESSAHEQHKQIIAS